MCITCEPASYTNTNLEMLEKDNEFLRKEIQALREEVDLLRMRIPPCPCGFTEMSYSKVEEVG